MARLGAHQSIAGGYYKAVDAAAELGMEVVQIFTRNTNQWRAKPLTSADIDQFAEALRQHAITCPIAHASYLINLASPEPELYRKSIDALVLELQRATTLGLDAVVVHPGAHLHAGEQYGLDLIVRAVDEALRRLPTSPVRLLLENTAGQGTNLGWRFEHLSYVLARVEQPQRVAVCIDTCHAFAAGYPLATARAYRDTLSALDQQVGLERVVAWHLNDSKREAGARVDRHEHIGRGYLGLEPFWRLLRDAQWRDTPMYLETAKGQHAGESYDARNLLVLRTLAQHRSLPSARQAIEAQGGLVVDADSEA